MFAAASLKTALDAILSAWSAGAGVTGRAAYAGSAALARQIEAGAPADLFISASPEWMDYLQERSLIDPASRHDLLGNRLVLIAPAATAGDVALAPGLDLGALLGDGRLAIGLTNSVPAGIYGREALTRLGLWEQVSNRLAQADNVRAALALVALGEAPLGVVYASDAVAEPRVRVVATFPEASHAPIVYPAALLAGSSAPQAAALLNHLSGAGAMEVFRRNGFVAPGEAG